MSLLDEIRSEALQPGGTCQYRVKVIDEHPEYDTAVQEARREGLTKAACIRFLRKRIPDLTEHSIDRHLNGGCQCRKEAASG